MTTRSRPWTFLLGCLLLSVPLGVAAVVTHGKPLVLGLPVSVVFIVFPAIAATWLTARHGGRRAVRTLWARLLPVPMHVICWAVAGAFPVGTWVAVFVIGPRIGLANPAWTTAAALVPLLLVVYAAGAVLEEVGWTCYCTGPVAARIGAAYAGLAIGLVWAMIHWLSWWAMGHSLGEVGAMSASTVIMRVVMTRLYLAARGSAAPSVVLHAVSNTVQTYPSGFTGVNPYLWLCCAVVVGSAAMLAVRAARGRTHDAASRDGLKISE